MNDTPSSIGSDGDGRARFGIPARILLGVEAAAWLTGVLLLGWAARGWFEAAIFQRQHRGLAASATAVATSALPATGDPIATLAIPRLDVEVVVAEGATAEVLERAAGRVLTSARPGDGGNVAIAAHRDSFFRPLKAIEEGDLVVLRSAAGERRYRVEWLRIVDRHDVEVIGPTDHSALTLVTCYPFGYVGSAPRRFIVRARAEDDPEVAARLGA